jgi:glyoxylase-like metal-dependent hydrolase (beta-lactamase superfamily II)
VLIFRQMFDPASSTYTYLLAEDGYAVLIDPVFEQVRRDGALIEELGLQLVATLDTHVHADHVTGAWLLKQRLGSSIAVSKVSVIWTTATGFHSACARSACAPRRAIRRAA